MVADELISKNRTNKEMIEEQSLLIKELASVQFLDHIPQIIIILNNNRQIVFFNEILIDYLKIVNPNSILGLRPGEAFNCVNSNKSLGGCGTSDFCKTCGALMAIIDSLNGKKSVQECFLTTYNGNALEMQVSTIPLNINNGIFSLFILSDISHEKRRRAYEKIFFHDILNTAGSLQGFIELLSKATPDNFDEYLSIVYSISKDLIEEILSHKLLTNAENNELTITPTWINTLDIINDMTIKYKRIELSEMKMIKMDDNFENFNIYTDKTLLNRTISNMIKNALEASNLNETITVGCKKINEYVEFWVHNVNFISKQNQYQIFNRSFSTKGIGRGLGTYSMKLLCEKFLKGSVRFETFPDTGTTFYANIPIKYTVD